MLGAMALPKPGPETRSTLTVSLEKAAADDLPVLLAWMQDFYAHEHIPFDAATSAATLRELLSHPAFGQVFKVVADGTPVGYAAVALGFSLEFGGRSAFLDELYVRPQSRGHGIGAIALRLLQDSCRRLGVKSLALEVNLDNTQAEALYRREGFTSNGRQLMTRRL
jgi:ribosomal protein S18 acetylase RimI-like enzyme